MHTGPWTIARSQAALDAALALCRGKYQEGFIRGFENLSGTTLRGKARQYGLRYRDSRLSILRRCREAGIPIGEETGDHNKRILVLG